MSVYTAVFKKIQKLTLEGAVDDMRHIRDSSTICLDGQLIQGSLRARLPLWQRGWFVNSAAYINELNAEGDWGIPRNAVKLARQILAAEAQYLEELQAASVAGLPCPKWSGGWAGQKTPCRSAGGVWSGPSLTNAKIFATTSPGGCGRPGSRGCIDGTWPGRTIGSSMDGSRSSTRYGRGSSAAADGKLAAARLLTAFHGLRGE
jgi:hypothetical protein